MKKLISLLSAVALFATLLTTVAFADANNKYYIEESRSGNLVTLHFVLETDQDIINTSSTLDLTDAVSKGVSVNTFSTGSATGVAFNVRTDTQKIISWSVVDTSAMGYSGTMDLGTVVFDISAATGDFTLTQKRAFAAKDSSKTVVTSSFTDTATGYVVTVGGGDPDPVVADINTTTGAVTFDRTNATLPASDVLDGQTVKVFSNEFTGVTANKRFSITHTPSATTKKYGTTIGEYFGISGVGTVDGIVKVAILFPEGMNASDFTIGMYDAE